MNTLVGAHVACGTSPRKALGRVALPDAPPDALRKHRAQVGAAHTGTVDSPPAFPANPLLSCVRLSALPSQSSDLRATGVHCPSPRAPHPPLPRFALCVSVLPLTNSCRRRTFPPPEDLSAWKSEKRTLSLGRKKRGHLWKDEASARGGDFFGIFPPSRRVGLVPC